MRTIDKPFAALHTVAGLSYTTTPDILRAHRLRRGYPNKLVFGAVIEPTVGFLYQNRMAWKKIYEKMMIEPGYQFLGSGAEHTVLLANDQTVLKIDRPSYYMGEENRQKRFAERQQLFATAKHYLGDFLLPQSIDMETAPLRPKSRAILTSQQFVRPAVPDLIHQTPTEIYTQLEAGDIAFPHVAERIDEFVHASRKMYDNEGLLPDIGGLANLVITETGNVILIDSHVTTPVVRSIPSNEYGFKTVNEEHQAYFAGLQKFSTTLTL